MHQTPAAKVQWRYWGEQRGSCPRVQQARGRKTAWPKLFYD